MSIEAGQEGVSAPRRNTWFDGVERPVGGTVFVKPVDAEDVGSDVERIALDSQ